jgi:hypothetical protein
MVFLAPCVLEWSLAFHRRSRPQTGGLNCSLEIQNIALVMLLLLLCHLLSDIFFRLLPEDRCIASLPHVGSMRAQMRITQSATTIP